MPPAEDAALLSRSECARALHGIYAHWERHQWSPFAIDFTTDAATFAELDDTTRAALLWILSQRFHAEFQVARLLAPFLAAAPDYECALVLATQVADEFRHVQAAVSVFENVAGIRGGIAAVRAVADAYMDDVAATLYEALEIVSRPLEESRDRDTFLRAVFGYHVLGEGVVGQITQGILPGRLEHFGAFPGVGEAQRLATRDETRHIAFGVTYVRHRVAEDPKHAWSVLGHVAEGFREMCTALLGTTAAELEPRFVAAYGLEPRKLYEEAMRMLDARLRAVGLDDARRRYGEPEPASEFRLDPPTARPRGGIAGEAADVR